MILIFEGILFHRTCRIGSILHTQNIAIYNLLLHASNYIFYCYFTSLYQLEHIRSMQKTAAMCM